MSKRHKGELTGGYAMWMTKNGFVVKVERRPLGYSQSHYRKLLKARSLMDSVTK